MKKEENIKELNIPYIGIKVEAIPTILNVLNNSKNDNDFILYYEDLGKKRKTITEYLASLRNLKLAERDKNGQTKINNSGLNLLNDDLDTMYQNLLEHCYKNFPDLKIIKNIIKEANIKTLNDLLIELQRKQYSIKRKQTLSSYFKFFRDADVSKSIIRKPSINNKEDIEYIQLYKYILYYSNKNNTKIIEFKDFNSFILSEYSGDKKLISEYFNELSNVNKVRLYQIDNANYSENLYLKIKNKYYSYFEVL